MLPPMCVMAAMHAIYLVQPDLSSITCKCRVNEPHIMGKPHFLRFGEPVGVAGLCMVIETGV